MLVTGLVQNLQFKFSRVQFLLLPVLFPKFAQSEKSPGCFFKIQIPRTHT